MATDFSALRKALPYVRNFRDQTFVIKLGGELCEDGAAIDRLVEQLALIALVGIKLIVVHGGGKHATALGEKLGVSSEFIAGRRVTSKEMLDVAKMSFAGQLNTDLIASFKKHGTWAVGMSGIDGNLMTARKRPPTKMVDHESGENREVDYGFVADIESVDTLILSHLIAGGYVPVICSLGADGSGQVLNINADTLASVIAASVGASKLCILGTVDGIRRDFNDPSSLISSLTSGEARYLIETGAASGGMIPKITTALDAIRRGVPKVHIISGIREDAVLQEIFTNEGSGTMLVADPL